MAKVVDVIHEYKILKTKRDFVVINTRGNNCNHSHFLHERAARNLIDIVLRKKIPKSIYFQEAAKRIILDEIYAEKIILNQRKGKKDKYVNNCR
ncbi:hypothetical protein SAMN02745120_0807 [Acetoanaerobium noterae]|uniref:Uncharacterized protein n=1 Tax=Acetoanaerobium noterae TaxID=745369 RepID=A0A1T5A6M4_9FIRM|nr:hypothetical protein [Acetoanaerobium noterae]SKB30535.1 hypothetical protein SAMN02745120_0807 [Acetoanaerobium noterae]